MNLLKPVLFSVLIGSGCVTKPVPVVAAVQPTSRVMVPEVITQPNFHILPRRAERMRMQEDEQRRMRGEAP